MCIYEHLNALLIFLPFFRLKRVLALLNAPLFFFDLEIEIYTTHTHTLFGEGRGDELNSLAPLGHAIDFLNILFYTIDKKKKKKNPTTFMQIFYK
jgi:hypothetical protein